MKSVLAKQEDGTIQLTITIPQFEVNKTWEEVIEDVTKTITIEGFRKGKAPKKLVEERIDKEKIKEEVLKKLLPKYYAEAIREHKVKPIINPKIHVSKLDDPSAGSGQGDWEFQAITCEMPEVDLDGYKDAVQKITAKSKILVPGKPFDSAQDKEPKFEDIIKTVVESVKVKIPQILIGQEVDRLLSQMIDEIKRLGLSLDQYLASTGKNPESLRAEYEQKARNDIILEFTLQKISEAENIIVEEKEVEEAIQKAKTDDERKNLEANRYLLTNILRQQKTLDFLKKL